MREPTATERRLMLVLGALILLLVCMIVGRAVRNKLDLNRTEQARLQGLLQEYQGWIAQADIWKERDQWLKAHPPQPWNREKSEADFAQMLQETVAIEGMEILGQRLAGSQPIGNFIEASIQMTIKGTTEEIIRWLHRIQQPGEFLAVRQLNLRLDSDKKNLRAEVGLTKFFRQPTESKNEETFHQTVTDKVTEQPIEQTNPEQKKTLEEIEQEKKQNPINSSEEQVSLPELEPLTPNSSATPPDEEIQIGAPPQLPLDDDPNTIHSTE